MSEEKEELLNRLIKILVDKGTLPKPHAESPEAHLEGDQIDPPIIIDVGFAKAKVSYLGANEIGGSIIEPEKYRGFGVSTSHIASFAMPFRPWYYYHGQMTLRGKEEMEQNLKEVCHRLDVFYANRDTIKAFYDSVPERSQATTLKRQVDEKKKEARRRLRAGGIDNKQYQKELYKFQGMQKAFESAGFQTKEKLEQFVEDTLGIHLTYNATEQLLSILEGQAR
jgi:hypothetical protein